MLKFVPRPGAWMETMKQMMGFPMVATAAWFAVTFVKLQGGVESLFALLVGCILVAMAAWTYGRWGAFHRSARSRWIATIVSVGLLGWAGVHALEKPPAMFEPWSAARVSELHKAGKPVFVDFTAEWCAICQVNKKVAVENKAVLEAFKAKGVTVLIADWTDQNDAVAKGLAEHGRAAVPLYLLYGRDPSKHPEILPQTLTPGIVLDALNKL
jgi:thiol:disulfide interchange protein DsbD